MPRVHRLMFVLLLALPALAQETRWLFTGESKHYTIQSTAEKKYAEQVLAYMDLCFETYARFLNPTADRMPKKKFNLVLYTGVDEYKKNGGPGRYGHYDGKNLVGYYHENQMLPTFSHEGMHQFTDICIPSFGRVPSWYSEGIAECIANNEVRQGKLYICLQKGPVPEIRVPVLKRALLDNTHIPLKDLLDYDRRKFQENHKLLYAESWAFCTFLLTAPKLEDRDKQLPDGKYKSMLVKFHNALLDPKMTPAEAATAAFRLNNKPLDLDAFEKEFREWVLKFPYEPDPPAEPKKDPPPEKK
jgi:hypothetical protein